MIKQQIESDIKTAMLAGEKQLVTTLRGLKSAILNVEVANGTRGQGLTDEEVIEVLTKEAKKRAESAEMYKQGGDEARHQAEMVEKAIIEKYLPEQMSDEELQQVVDEEVGKLPTVSLQAMGPVIAAVKSRTSGKADGARIARLVKEKLSA